MQQGEEALLLAPLTHTSRRFVVFVSLLLAVVVGGGLAYAYQLINGLGVTGMNRPVYWGVYIVNFVFFIGLAHSGTFISAILRLVGADCASHWPALPRPSPSSASLSALAAF